jgi:NSS family neurotransmitter:Na+ symporter
LFEPAVAIISRDLDVPRLLAVIIVAAAVWLLATVWLTQPSLAALVDGYLIPLFAPALIAVIAIFVGWLVPRPILRGEQFKERPWLFSLWMMTLRWLTPAACIILLLDQAQLLPI